MFDKVSQDVPSFGALPRKAWMTLGIVELVCTVGLIVPAALHWQPPLTILAAAVLAVESLVFVWVHVKYREVAPTILSSQLCLLMAFIVYGRMVLHPDLLNRGPSHRGSSYCLQKAGDGDAFSDFHRLISDERRIHGSLAVPVSPGWRRQGMPLES
jgi:hypothetical protein